MRLDDDRYEEIKKEVIFLFEQYDIKCIPISGFEIASKMGIILIPYSSLSKEQKRKALKTSKDGFYCEPGDGKEYIYYHDRGSYERTNMTILHEVAHAVLGHHDDMDHDEMEAEASFFAKYAASPPPLVHKIKPSSAEDIQDAFSVSYEAALYSFEYYKKWLNVHARTGKYSICERHLLRLFRSA